MRIWIIVVVASLVGLALGLGSTVAEFGLWPNGAGRVEFGPKTVEATPPPPTNGPPPKVVIAPGETEYDFGKAEKDTPQRHDFVVHNGGKGPLTLKMWKTSCSCTKAEVEHTEVPPGGETKIIVEWNTKSTGPFRQSASVLTNDPEQTTIQFDVTGEIVSSLRMEPEKVVVTSLAPGKGSTATVRIYSFGVADLEVLRNELSNASTAKFYDVAVEKMPANELKQEAGAKSGCLLRITVKPGLPAGPFEQRIHLHLNLPGDPEVVLPVEGKVNSPIEVASGTGEWSADQGILMLGQLHSSEGGKGELFFMVREGAQEKVELKLAKPAPTPLKVTIGKLEKLPGAVSRIPVTIEVPPGSRPVDHLGNDQSKLSQLLFDTGLPDAPQLKVLVRYIIEE